MYLLAKFFLFKKDPEKAHYFVIKYLKKIFKIGFLKGFISSIYKIENKNLNKHIFGLNFQNPVGLAAGFDKNADFFEEMDMLGFGFVEVGTVTPLAQDGNEKPRLFRLVEDEAIINRMGFNNLGVDEMLEKLKKRKNKNLIIGGNIGKNKITPNEEAVNDYIICFNKLKDYVDYFVVNVSSPNTPNLRELQEKEPLKKLLFELQKENEKIKKPILLKIAPDLTNEQLDDIVEIVIETRLDGVIAGNTTISREGLKTNKNEVEAIGMGGLSGKPLKKRSTEVIKYLADKAKGRFEIIGVGGIHHENDAIEKLNAGASLVQLYTGFIYEGPALVKRINKKLIEVNANK